MKKNRIIVVALIVLFLAAAVSIWMNISNSSEQTRIRKTMINQAYSELYTISINLNGVLINIEEAETVADYERNQQSLTMLSNSFSRLHTILKWYATCFPPKGISRNVYSGGPFDFDFIAYTLTAGTGTGNDVRYSGITADGVISENEVRYLSILKDDVDIILAAMVSPDNPPQENQNLTVNQIDDILNTFFSKWSFHNDSSPYFLLRSE